MTVPNAWASNLIRENRIIWFKNITLHCMHVDCKTISIRYHEWYYGYNLKLYNDFVRGFVSIISKEFYVIYRRYSGRDIMPDQGALPSCIQT